MGDVILKFILIQTNTVITIIRFYRINDKVWVHCTLPHFVVNHCGLQDIRLLHGWTLAGFELRGQASSGNSWYLPLSTPAQNTDLTCVPLPQSTEHCQVNVINLLCWHVVIFDDPKERDKFVRCYIQTNLHPMTWMALTQVYYFSKTWSPSTPS